MSLLEKIETKEDNKEMSEEKKRAVEKEVKKLREYDRLGFVGE